MDRLTSRQMNGQVQRDDGEAGVAGQNTTNRQKTIPARRLMRLCMSGISGWRWALHSFLVLTAREISSFPRGCRWTHNTTSAVTFFCLWTHNLRCNSSLSLNTQHPLSHFSMDGQCETCCIISLSMDTQHNICCHISLFMDKQHLL